MPGVSARVGEQEGGLEEAGALEVVVLGVMALEVVAMEEVVLEVLGIGVAIWVLGALVLLVPQGVSKK